MTTRSFEEVTASVAANRIKKRLKSLPETDFVITITPLDAFKTLVCTLDELIQEVTFEVVHDTPAFSGIRTDMTNRSLVCMIKAKFSALVKLPEGTESAKFSVTVKDLKNIFKAAQGQTMDIIRLKDDDCISMCCYGSPLQEFKIRTLNADNDSDKLNNIDTKLQVQLDTDDLKNYCRCVSNFGAEYLTIEIRSDGEPVTDKVVTTYTSLRCSTDFNEYCITYKQKTRKDAEGQLHFVCDSVSGSDEISKTEFDGARVLYAGEFPVSFIQGFLKNSDKGSVWIALAIMEDGSPGPMILHVGLGDENSYMRLVVAPKMDDSED